MPIKIRLAIIAAAVSASCVAVYAADGDAPVYNVTFDDISSEYELVSADLDNTAQLVESDYGKAVDIKGGAYVKLKDNITLGMTGDYSISVDVMPRSELSFARVFDIGTGTDNTMWFACFGGKYPKFRFKGNDFIANNIKPKLEEWNRIVITREGTNAKLYINGELAASSNTFHNDLNVIGSTDKNYLGKSQYPSDPGFDGMIDNFAIYDYAIPESAIVTENNPHIEVKCYYISDSAGVLNAIPKNGIIMHDELDLNKTDKLKIVKAITAAAEVKNYTVNDKEITLITMLYDTEGNLVKTVSSTQTVKAGETLNISNNAGDTSEIKLMKSYIYTKAEGLRHLSDISQDGVYYPKAAPEDSLETTIGVHDPSIFKDPKTGMYYVYSTGMIDIFKSEDLIHWTRTEGTLPKLPECVFEKYDHDTEQEYSNIWAPDMWYNEDDEETPYYLTCSYSDKFGANSSSLILFKAASPEGPWENGKIIFSSNAEDTSTNMVNAIDSHICEDAENGRKYMIYGSFWQGIHQLELDDQYNITTEGIGKCIESRFKGIGGPEGGYIVYNPETKYYYLFTSYDDLSSTYTIRVARSRSITGPYSDQNGESVNRFNDNEANAGRIFGYKLMGSYQFKGETTYYAPGHNSVLNDNGDWYLVHHTRVTNGGYATLHVRKMLWTEDGWPIVSPERYAGEKIQDIPAEAVKGTWELVNIGENTKDMVFSKTLALNEDGTAMLDGGEGTWSLSGNELNISIKDRRIKAYVLPSYDRDKNAPNLVFTGTDESSCGVWGKKTDSSVVIR